MTNISSVFDVVLYVKHGIYSVVCVTDKVMCIYLDIFFLGQNIEEYGLFYLLLFL